MASIADIGPMQPGVQAIQAKITLHDNSVLTLGSQIHCGDKFANIQLAPIQVRNSIETSIHGDVTNQKTMDLFFGPSIARVERIGDQLWATSPRSVLNLSIDLSELSTIPLIEWRLPDGETTLGAQTKMTLVTSGKHGVSVGPPARAAEANFIAYSTRVIPPERGWTPLAEGVPLTFHAQTTPPGYEHLVSWLSSTKYGAASPALGRGSSFTTTFSGIRGSTGSYWIGTKANESGQAADGGGAPQCDLDLDSSLICLNADDDDDDEIADKNDAPVTANENDLVRIQPSGSGGTLWSITYTNQVKVWMMSNRTGLIASGACMAFPIPSQLYVEGVITSAAANDVTLTLAVKDGEGAVLCSIDKPATVYRVFEIHPLAADFSAGNVGRALISTKHDDTYHTSVMTTRSDDPAQTEDRKIVISAYVTPLIIGASVFFEVLDPDDPSVYDEDTDPKTIYQFPTAANPALPNNIEGPAPNTDPNDNRDATATMVDGTLAAYTAFQGSLSSRSAVTVLGTINGTQRAVAEVTLTITNRFTGDNYLARATCNSPNGKPFNEGSNVSDSNADANILDSAIEETTELIAWKRVYYEEDQMYRRGSALSANAADAQNMVTVADASGFAIGEMVRVIDTMNRESLLSVSSKAGNTLTLSGNLLNAYTTANAGFVGEESGTPADFYIADTSKSNDTFGDACVEFMRLSAGSTSVPLVEDMAACDLFAFNSNWFDNKAQSGNNYLYLVGGKTGVGFNGASTFQLNFSFIFINTHTAPKVRDIFNHEFVHQWQTESGQPQAHDDNVAHDDSDQCLMDGDFPRNGVDGRNDEDDMHEAGIDHLYRIRDFADSI